jgi:hypothetical protein
MRRHFTSLVLFAVLASCAGPPKEPNPGTKEMTASTSLVDTLPSTKAIGTDTAKGLPEQPAPPTEPKESAPKPAPKVEQKPASPIDDSEVHRFSDGKTSVIITLWREGKRKITVFDKTGKVTYSFDDTRTSYSSVTTLHFREDGSVQKAQTNLNPGASMYMHYASVTFDTDNTPLEQRTWKVPAESPLDGDNVSTWDKTQQKWVRNNQNGRLPDGY